MAPTRTLPVLYSVAVVAVAFRWSPDPVRWQVTTMPTVYYRTEPEPVEFTTVCGPVYWSLEMSTTVQLVAHQGEDIRIPSGPLSGQPVRDLTGKALVWRLYDRAGGAPILERSTANGGVVITDGPAMKFEVRIPSAESAALAVKRDYFHQARQTDPGENTVFFEGGFDLRP